MRKIMGIIVGIIVLCGTAWGEYLVIHAPAKSDFFAGSIIQIDPCMDPSYKYEMSKSITKKFDTLKEVVEYLNDVKPEGVEVYKIETVNLKQHERVINRKVVEDKKIQWTLEGEEPVWRERNEIIWISPKEDFSNVSGYPTGVTIFTRW